MGKNGANEYDPGEMRELVETVKLTFGVGQSEAKRLIVKYARSGMETEKVMVKYGC